MFSERNKHVHCRFCRKKTFFVEVTGRAQACGHGMWTERRGILEREKSSKRKDGKRGQKI